MGEGSVIFCGRYHSFFWGGDKSVLVFNLSSLWQGCAPRWEVPGHAHRDGTESDPEVGYPVQAAPRDKLHLNQDTNNES